MNNSLILFVIPYDMNILAASIRLFIISCHALMFILHRAIFKSNIIIENNLILIVLFIDSFLMLWCWTYIIPLIMFNVFLIFSVRWFFIFLFAIFSLFLPSFFLGK